MPTVLTINMTLAHCAQIMANDNLKCQEYWKQEAIDAVIVNKIIHKGVDAGYIKEHDDASLDTALK